MVMLLVNERLQPSMPQTLELVLLDRESPQDADRFRPLSKVRGLMADRRKNLEG